MTTPYSNHYIQWVYSLFQIKPQMHSGLLKPAYQCDEWEQETRFCFLLRNVGNTVTFALAVPPSKWVGKVTIEWFQGFTYLNETKWEGVRINPKDPPWNMVIGSEGRELRLSPITESDISVNYFTAISHFQHGKVIRKVHFTIQAMPTDIGLVYPGDTLTIHMPSYVSLPAESMTYKWGMEGSRNLLPSNMRTSRSGASLTISELRKEQEGILSCGAFTNLGVFVTQKRFLIKNVKRANSKLIFAATRPPHVFIPVDIYKARLKPMLDFFTVYYGKREIRNLSEEINQLSPELLEQVFSEIPQLLTKHSNSTVKRNKRSPQPPEGPDFFIEPEDNQVINADVITDDIYLRNGKSFMSRNLYKRQDDAETPTIEENDQFRGYDAYEKYEPHKRMAPNKNGYFGDFDYHEEARFEQEALDEETTPRPPRPTKPLTLLEQRRQAILERLYGSKSTEKISETMLGATTETSSEIFDEESSSLPPLQERDTMAMLISECHRDSQCSLNADCVIRKKGKPGFCRCRPKFEGNGIFCWENDKSME